MSPTPLYPNPDLRVRPLPLLRKPIRPLCVPTPLWLEKRSEEKGQPSALSEQSSPTRPFFPLCRVAVLLSMGSEPLHQDGLGDRLMPAMLPSRGAFSHLFPSVGAPRGRSGSACHLLSLRICPSCWYLCPQRKTGGDSGEEGYRTADWMLRTGGRIGTCERGIARLRGF